MNLEKIIENLEEPEWLKILRKENLDLFIKHPFPKWKRIDISTLKIEELDFCNKEVEFNSGKEDGIILVDSRNSNGKLFK